MTRGLPIGTFINMATVLAGGALGLWLQQLFPENVQAIVFQALGLATLLIGIQMALKVPEGYLLVVIFSLIVGGVLGEVLALKDWLEGLGDAVKTAFAFGDARFTEGLITAFLLFCIGSMTIVGAIEEGLGGKRDLLLIKSTLDGVSSIAFAATYGVGVLFSVVPMLLFQGGMTVAAKYLERFFTPTLIAQLSSTGGILIIGIGLNLLQATAIHIENLLPSLLVVVLLTRLYDWGKARTAASE